MPVGIVGGRGSGKTVFFSFLANTAINYSAESRGKNFRYFTDPKVSTLIGEMVDSLTEPAWPEATPRKILSQHGFWFGWPTRLGKQLEKVGHPRFSVLHFNMYDIAGEDANIKRAAQESEQTGTDLMDTLPENLRTVLNCNVLIFVVDIATITSDVSEKRKEQQEYDTSLSALVSLVATHKARNAMAGRRPTLVPIFALTKFDLVEPAVLDSFNFPKDTKAWFEEMRRKSKSPLSMIYDFGQKERDEAAFSLLQPFFPKTIANLFGSRMATKINMDKTRLYFSSVSTQRNKFGKLVPAMVPEKPGKPLHLDYSVSEYRAMIDFFGKRAGEIRDAERDEKDLPAWKARS